MDQMTATGTKRAYRVHIVKHRATDMLLGISDDLPGLMIYGESEAEIADKTPGAVREMLEAQGHRVGSVTTEPPGGTADSFAGMPVIANAELLVGA